MSRSEHFDKRKLLERPVLPGPLARRVLVLDVLGGDVTFFAVPFELAGPGFVADPVAVLFKREGRRRGGKG